MDRQGSSHLMLVAGNGNPALAQAIARELGTRLASATVDRFRDGETRVLIHDPVVGTDAFVIQPTSSDHLIMELHLLVDALRLAGARSVTACVSYYGYARQDRRIGQSPVSAALVARHLEAAGVDQLIVVDWHKPALKQRFRIPVENIVPVDAFVAAWQRHGLARDLVIAAPDAGARERALWYARAWQLEDVLVLEKSRTESGCTVTGDARAARGRSVMLVDDIVSSGDTLLAAARHLAASGAHQVFVSVTHMVLPHVLGELNNSPIERLFVTDSLPAAGVPHGRLERVSVAPLLARAIRDSRA